MAERNEYWDYRECRWVRYVPLPEPSLPADLHEPSPAAERVPSDA